MIYINYIVLYYLMMSLSVETKVSFSRIHGTNEYDEGWNFKKIDCIINFFYG